MKKKLSILLLAGACLTLSVGCQTTASSFVSSSSKQDNSSSYKDENTSSSKDDKVSSSKEDNTSSSKDDKVSSSKEDNTSSSKDDKVSSSKEDNTSSSKDDKVSSSKEDNTSSSSSTVPEIKEWPSSVVELMETNLKTVLPYIDLGSKNLQPFWDDNTSTLTLTGAKQTITEAQLTEAKATYVANQWKADVSDGKMIATDTNEYITVEYFEEDGYAMLSAKYGEVFNPSIATAWPTDMVTEMNQCMKNHGTDIPYVYLGTRNPTGSWYQGTYTIKGGVWNDKVLDLAKSAFDAATGWEATKNADTVNASITLTDETELSVRVYMPAGTGLATMTIQCHEKFSAPTSAGAWSNKITDVFTDDFDGHSIPWFYTGGTPDLMSRTAGDTTMTIMGAPNSWDDQILTLAKNACTTENASIEKEENQWKFDESTSDELICTIHYADGSSLEFSVKNRSTRDNKAEIEVCYAPAFSIPASGAWSKEITDVFTNDFDGHSIPWFYIGGGKTIVEERQSGDKTLAFYGAKYTWKDSIFDLAIAAFSAENATISDKDNKWSYEYEMDGERIVYKRKFEDGCRLKLTLQNYSESENKAEIHVTYTEKFTPPASGRWPEEIRDLFGEYDGYKIPWFYLGGEPELIDDEDDDDTTATIYAPEGTWDDQILTLAQSACTAENETITEEDNQWECEISEGWNGKRLSATRTLEDGCEIEFTVYNTGNDRAIMQIEFTKNPEKHGKWVEDFDDVLEYWDEDNGHYVPWFYFGADDDDIDVDYDYESAHATITGAYDSWEDRFLTLAKNACEADNEDITEDEHKWNCSLSDTEFTATRLYEDGCTISFKLWNDDSTPTIDFSYMPAFDYPTGDDAAWSDDIKTEITNLLGESETIPWIYLGSTEVDSTSSTELVLTGEWWNDAMMDKAKEELDKVESSGWTYTQDSKTELTATKTTGDKTITMVLSKSSTDYAELHITVTTGTQQS